MEDSCGRKVLLVEDDPDIRDAVGGYLEMSGFNVIPARNGREALERLLSNPDCDAILLDLVLPDMSGWEFRVMQWRNPLVSSIPVVLLSGIATLQQTSGLLDAAASLAKPVDLDRLVAVLEAVIDGADGLHGRGRGQPSV